LPRGVPDRGRRGPAGRRALLSRRGLGVRRRGQPAHPPRRAARLRVRPAPDPELQMSTHATTTPAAGGPRTEATAGPAGGHGSPERTINLTLNVWRQKDRASEGRFVTYEAREIST